MNQRVGDTTGTRPRLRPGRLEDRAFLVRLRELAETATLGRLRVRDEAFEEARLDRDLENATLDIVQWGQADIGARILAQEHGRTVIRFFTLLPRWQGLGIGSQLLGDVVTEAQGMGAAVEVTLHKADRARNLFLRHGFAMNTETLLTITLLRAP